MQISKYRLISLFVLAVVLTSTFTYAYAQAQTFYINAYSGTQGYSYVIFQIGSIYYSKNGITGAIDYVSTNASYIFNVLTATSGNRIFFKNGIYTLLVGIVFPMNNVVLVGESWNAVLKAGDATKINVIKINPTVNGITLKDFAIDGNKENQPYSTDQYIENGIWDASAESGDNGNNLFDHLYIYDIYGHGMLIVAEYDNTINCLFQNIGRSGIRYDGGTIQCSASYNEFQDIIENGIYSEAGYDMLWSNNKFVNIGSSAIRTLYASQIVISSNIIYYTNGSAIVIQDSKYCSVNDNKIYYAGAHGIFVLQDNVGYISSLNSIDNNVVMYSARAGLYISKSGNITVTGGIYFENSRDPTHTYSAIQIYNTNYSIFAGIQGIGNLGAVSAETQDEGFREDGTSDYNIIESCIFRLNWSGIGITTVGANTKVHNCWNQTEWIS